LHAVDELTVEVADLGGEPPLAEIIVVGRRRLVAGQIEDADVDRGDDDARLLARGESIDFDRDAQRYWDAAASVNSCRAQACVLCD
jgi:hypothetical protein